jgi:hypothetical protein
MRVLVACEESQEVCKAFRAKGHEAYRELPVQWRSNGDKERGMFKEGEAT